MPLWELFLGVMGVIFLIMGGIFSHLPFSTFNYQINSY